MNKETYSKARDFLLPIRNIDRFGIAQMIIYSLRKSAENVFNDDEDELKFMVEDLKFIEMLMEKLVIKIKLVKEKSNGDIQ